MLPTLQQRCPRLLVLVTFACALSGAIARADITLVANGQSHAVIVLPDHPDDETATASQELQDYIRKCSGVEIAVIKEHQVDSRKPAPQGFIYVGPCRKTRDAVNMDTHRPEELVIVTQGANLFITGKDGGTLYGVYHWLREQLGVDWIMPGELGEITPRTSSITVGKVDYRYQPPVMKRDLRTRPWNEKTSGAIVKLYRALDLAGADEAMKKVEAFYRDADTRWFQRWGAGSRISVQFGHAFNDYWEKYGETHPQVFALQPNGSRIQDPKRERLCKSEPVLWDLVAQRQIEEFDANPTRQMSSICPNDGGPNKFCMCTRCVSWDPPHAPKIKHGGLVNHATGKPFDEYPSLSDRVFRFYNEVAERVARKHPDKRLGVYAYSVYQTLPVEIKKLHPALVVQLVSLDPELVTQWSKLTSHGQLFLRPNIWHNYMALSQNSARWLARAVKHGVDKGAIGFDCDGNAWNWGTEGLDYYVLVRAMWDPSVDVDALITRYCRIAYGPGATAMRKYHDRLEAISERVRDEGKFRLYRENLGAYASYYTPDVIRDLETLLDEAKRAVSDKDSPDYQRIMLADTGLRYTRMVSSLFALAASGQKSTADYKKEHKELLVFLTDHLTSYSINSAKTYHYVNRAFSYAAP